MARTIQLPVVQWTLGDTEQCTINGVTIVTRPLYYRAKADMRAVQVGSINPDYAERLIDALTHVKTR